MNTNITLTISEKVNLSSLLYDMLYDNDIDNATELCDGVSRVKCSFFLFDGMEDDLRSILEKLG